MTSILRLSKTHREILRVLGERPGASVAYLQRTLPGRDFATMPAASVRRAIGELRDAGYDIVFGTKSSCDGRRLYEWVKSPVTTPQAVARPVSSREDHDEDSAEW